MLYGTVHVFYNERMVIGVIVNEVGFENNDSELIQGRSQDISLRGVSVRAKRTLLSRDVCGRAKLVRYARRRLKFFRFDRA